MKILFFEIDAINVKRYYLDVLPDLLKRAEVSIILESSEQAEQMKRLDDSFRIACVNKSSLSGLEELIGTADYLFINGQRIPDIMMSLLASKVGTQTVYVQHGMYIPYMKRGVSFYMSSMHKTIRYLKYALIASKIDQNPGLLLKLFRSHLLDGKRDYNFKLYNGFPDIAFVYSDYWVKWHKQHYFNSDYNGMRIVGNPEPVRFDVINFDSSHIIYCYQTLIEDGRIDKKYMMDIIHSIISWVRENDKSLVVKAHPRMSSEVRDYFSKQDIQIVKDKLPVAPVVIGHYSTLMPLWAHYGSTVFSLKLRGHFHNIDESINKTSIEILDLPEIKEHIKGRNFEEIDFQKNVEYYFNYDSSYSRNITNQLLA